MVRVIPAVTAALILCSGFAHAAGGDSVKEQLQALTDALAAQKAQLEAQQRQLEEQAREIERLRAAVDTAPATPAAPLAPGSAAEVAAVHQDVDQAKIAMINGRLAITSSDGRSSIAIRGVAQLDMAHYDQSPPGSLTTDFRRGSVGATGNRETNAAGDLSDGAYFRRARLGVEGLINRDFNYRLLFEFGGAGVEAQGRINDAWINYTGFAPFALYLGAFSPPANMDDGTPPEELVFIERATPSELSRSLGGADGRLGFGVRGSGTRWMSSLALTSRTVGDAEVFDSQLAAVGRFGWLAATSADYNVHVGVNATYVFQPPDQGVAATPRYPTRLRDRPEIRVDSTRLIDTGSFDADSIYSAGVEVGANWKNGYLQAENFWYGFERRSPSTLGNPSFGGWYAQASWILTGETRRYNMANGSFSAPRPFVPFTMNGGRGAWELAMRYSRTDLDHDAGLEGTACPVGCIRGGVQDIWTLGVNWYLNPQVRLIFNYLRIDVDRLNPAGPGNTTPFGPAPGTPPIGVQIGQDLDVFALRSQFSF
ncbi:MAG TPA: porin [Steroidobacteraceae bacterium]|nr:porin [Steroidobacteraceae bacterium]